MSTNTINEAILCGPNKHILASLQSFMTRKDQLINGFLLQNNIHSFDAEELMKIEDSAEKQTRLSKDLITAFDEILSTEAISLDKDSAFHSIIDPISKTISVLRGYVEDSPANDFNVKAGLHTELQKFGKKPNPEDISPLETSKNKIDQKETETNFKVEVIGIVYSSSQSRALGAIQKLFTDTNYKGNSKGIWCNDGEFKYKGILPVLTITHSDYLDAYGLEKRLTKRKYQEFNSNERSEAIKALVDLSTIQVLFVYKKETRTKNPRGKGHKLTIDRIETIAPLIRLANGWESLTPEEDKLLDLGVSTPTIDKKAKYIKIIPAPTLVDQIDSYFVLKPANLYQEIRLLTGKKPSKTAHLFIDYLYSQAELKRRNNQPLTITITQENLAYTLKLNNYIKSRQRNRVKETIDRCIEIAKQGEWILEVGKGVGADTIKMELNPDRFYKPKKQVDAKKRKVANNYKKSA